MLTPLGHSLEAFVTRSMDAYLLVSAGGVVEFANAAAAKILSAVPERIVGTRATQWIPEIDSRSMGAVSEVETEGRSARGDAFPVEVSVVPIDDHGRAWISFRDISRRRGFFGSMKEHADALERMVTQRQVELNDAVGRCKKLYDLAPVIDFELDSQNAIASANRKSCVTLGVALDRLVGLPLANLVVAEDRASLQAALEKAREGSLTPFETRLRGANGVAIDVVFHNARTDAVRSPLRIIGLDVTARREAERLVDQSLDLAEAQRSRMERILRGLGECLLVTDPDGQVRLMNKLAEEAFGITESLAFGRDLLLEQHDDSFRDQWRAFLASTGERGRGTWEKADGRCFHASFSRVRTPEGRPAGCVVVLVDVTRERKGDRVKRNFVASITNDLRTPLASIRGFIGTVLRGENRAPEDNARFLWMIDKEAERLQQLVEDLLSLASLEAGQEELHAKSADFVGVLRQAKAMFDPAAHERGISLGLETGRYHGAGVFDAEKIRRVLDNLIGNALKFTEPGGSVTVQFQRYQERLECAVRDTGPGIEPHRLERIFDRFDSMAASTGGPWGTGLGLHIVRGLVHLHGGEIAAESRLGEGSTFRFWIPARPLPAKPRDEAPPRPPVSDALIDDPDPAESFLPGRS